MTDQSAFTLINPHNGHLAFKILLFEDNSYFDHIQRNNYYSLIWVTQGNGKVKADFSEYEFEENSLFAFSPYQPFMFEMNENVKGSALQFHPDFFCIHKHHKEVACHGVLFNNIYQGPFVWVDKNSTAIFGTLVEQMKAEIQNPGLAQHDLLVSYLKIFLIAASRLRTEQQPQVHLPVNHKRVPIVLQKLKEEIEKDFKKKHSPGEYAKSLNISSRALAKITKNHFNKTLTELISERIIMEAKRELYLTDKPVKEIAWELGYEDEYYFSRFFKANTDISPQLYRNAVGFARGVA